jgi:hypothetical protein
MAKIIYFPCWLEVLDASNLSSELRESFKVTLRWYLAWCSRQSLACSVESARNFIEWAEAEKKPSLWMTEGWKEASRWFFVSAKAQARASQTKCDAS